MPALVYPAIATDGMECRLRSAASSPAPGESRDLLAQDRHPGADTTTIELDLRLAWPARADAGSRRADTATRLPRIDSPQPRRRGRRYSSWASSTCALPSRVFACWAKMSRITAVRSMTFTLTTSSSARRWLTRELRVHDDRVRPDRFDESRSSLRLAACPGRSPGSGWCRASAGRRRGLWNRRSPRARRVRAGAFSASRDRSLTCTTPTSTTSPASVSSVLDFGDVLELGRQARHPTQRVPVLDVPLVAVGASCGRRRLLQRLCRPEDPHTAAGARAGQDGIDGGVGRRVGRVSRTSGGGDVVSVM